jgi:hypothetical protein
MKVGLAITRHHYQRLDGFQRAEETLSAVEAYAEKCLGGQVQDTFSVGLDLSVPPDEYSTNIAGFGWGPSGLDWAGWDWNDLSHLFEHGE